MKIHRLLLHLECALCLSLGVTLPAMAQNMNPPPSQTSGSTLAERLGYPPDARLLIIHADDIGVAHSVNRASIAALETGLVNSGSIMVPCPWFPEIAAYLQNHPEHDLGLHLTVTSEWEYYQWGPVLPITEVPSLVDEQGYFYATTAEAVQHIAPKEAEAEIRAQVDRAIAFGIQPTHLDSHMGVFFQTPALFEAYLRVGRDYNIPVLIPDGIREGAPALADLLTPEDLVIDDLTAASPAVPEAEWDAFYTGLVENLEPGITEIIIHLAYDDAEMQAVTVEHPDYGAAWRQRDFDFFTSPAFRALLEREQVELITWREIGSLLP